MPTISDTKANEYLDDNFGSGSPATWYIGRFTSMPSNGDLSNGTEVAGGAYARVAVTNNDTNFPDAVNRQKTNAAAITWAQATANQGTTVGIGFFTALSGGNPVYAKTLNAPKTVNNGDTFSIAADQLVINVPSS